MDVPFLPDELEQLARGKLLVGGTEIARRRGLNVIGGTNVTPTAVDNPAQERVDLTLAVASAAPSGAAGGALSGTYPNPDLATGVAGNGLALASNVLSVGVDGSSIEISSDALRVKAGGITQAMLASGYRATYSGTSAPSSPSAGDLWFDSANNLVNLYNGSVWITLGPQAATVATSQTRASATYGDLTTVGPSVTLLTGTKVWVTLGFLGSNNTVGQTAQMAVAVSGATTRAAADTEMCYVTSFVAGQGLGLSRSALITGLTAGSNTFTAKYKCSANTATFANRNIAVEAIPT